MIANGPSSDKPSDPRVRSSRARSTPWDGRRLVSCLILWQSGFSSFTSLVAGGLISVRVWMVSLGFCPEPALPSRAQGKKRKTDPFWRRKRRSAKSLRRGPQSQHGVSFKGPDDIFGGPGRERVDDPKVVQDPALGPLVPGGGEKKDNGPVLASEATTGKEFAPRPSKSICGLRHGPRGHLRRRGLSSVALLRVAALIGSQILADAKALIQDPHRTAWEKIGERTRFRVGSDDLKRSSVEALTDKGPDREGRAPRTAPSGHQAKSLVTASALTSSRGWLRWFKTIVAGSMPKAW